MLISELRKILADMDGDLELVAVEDYERDKDSKYYTIKSIWQDEELPKIIIGPM